MRSAAGWLASAEPAEQEKFLRELTDETLAALPYLFEVWAHDHQLPPEGDWRTWAVIGGRGAGKTRAGSEWVRSMVEGARPLDPGRARRVALVGETFDQAREVMVFGESGLLAVSPPDRRPEWQAGRRALVWPNGAEAQVFSAFDPEALRGPQFDAAWADEIGCAAIDKGANQPNRFLDDKSSESGLPAYSNGRRDDLMQVQFLRAVHTTWSDPANNPVSSVYGGPMVDMSNAHVWAWDARPYPYFPHVSNRWSDTANYYRGHWLNGRVNARTLADTVEEICGRAGIGDVVSDELYGLVRGYVSTASDTARAALQPLVMVHGVEAIERDGALCFRNRTGRATSARNPDGVVWNDDDASPVVKARSPEAEAFGRVRLRFLDGDGDYEALTEEAVFPGDSSDVVTETELPLVLTRYEARVATERWLAESRVAQDELTITLPPSAGDIGAGDVIAWSDAEEKGFYRVDRATRGEGCLIEAVRVEPEVFEPSDAADVPAKVRPFAPPTPVFSQFLDLPLLTGNEIEHAPHLAVTARPWPGSVAVFGSSTDSNYQLNTLVSSAATIGQTASTLGPARHAIWDHGPALRVVLAQGSLASATVDEVLNGSNLAAIGDGTSGNWEVIQFADAVLVGPDTWDIATRLRGLAGTDALPSSTWPAGSVFVLLDGKAPQIDLLAADRGLARHYRIGPATRPFDDPVYEHFFEAFDGIGLRPLAPVHLRVVTAASGDRTLTWVRRTRIDGDSWQSVDVPLGEDAELYEVRVKSAAGTIVRSTTVSSPSWTYTAAMQLADAAGVPFSMEVAQISTRFGPGLFRRIDIDV